VAVLLSRIDRRAVVRRSIECPAADGADGTEIADADGLARDGFRMLLAHVDV
jgi:hypothetical protein